MSLTPRALETLIDLVEIKLSCLEVIDREDARERDNLEHCLCELTGLAGDAKQAASQVIELPTRGRKRQRAVAAAG
ncbi:MAG: hypothetical protein AAF495_07190 [Pseudomonadota bacterium]